MEKKLNTGMQKITLEREDMQSFHCTWVIVCAQPTSCTPVRVATQVSQMTLFWAKWWQRSIWIKWVKDYCFCKIYILSCMISISIINGNRKYTKLYFISSMLLKCNIMNYSINIIYTGAGEKAFCAGGDVRSIVEGKTNGSEIGPDFFREEYMLNCLIGTLHIPYIALIDGNSPLLIFLHFLLPFFRHAQA